MSQQRMIESEHNDFYRELVAIKDGKRKKDGLLLISALNHAKKPVAMHKEMGMARKDY